MYMGGASKLSEGGVSWGRLPKIGRRTLLKDNLE